MASVKFNPAVGIQSIHGRLGNYIFYTRNGKQYVRERRAVSAEHPPVNAGGAASAKKGHLPADIEPISSHSRAVSESEHVLKIEKSCRKH